MITKYELISIARLKGISNIGYAEKDYLLELVLFLLSRNTKQEFVFKGGTALYKFYKLERFSDDLDFSVVGKINLDNLIKKLISDLSKFKIDAEVHRIKEPFNSILISLRLKGPLYTGDPRTMSTIRIDLNLKSAVELQPTLLGFSSIYTEIPSFEIIVMQEREILAEKIRAIITRNKARDVFDSFSLLKKGIKIDKKLIEKKLEYYNLKFNNKKLLDSVEEKKKLWETELKPLLKELPKFNEVKNKILSEI